MSLGLARSLARIASSGLLGSAGRRDHKMQAAQPSCHILGDRIFCWACAGSGALVYYHELAVFAVSAEQSFVSEPKDAVRRQLDGL